MATKKELRALITLAGKVDPSLQSAMLKATGQTKKLSEHYKDSTKHASRLSDIIKGSFVGSLAANGVSYLIGQIRQLGSESIDLASSLIEVQNVVDTTFRNNSNAINRFAKTALEDFGLSELQAKQFSGTLGAMFKSSGVADADLVKLSTDLAGLSGDLASFYNLDIEEAFTKIRSGISGETEPLKQLGINMSVANLEAFALSKGIKTQYQSMTQAEQALLRYNYLMATTADQQGDFAKTSGEYANQQRLFDTNLKQASATIASAFLPYLNKALIKGNEFFKSTDFNAMAISVGKGLELAGNGFKFLADNGDVILPLLGGVFGYFTAIKAINFAASIAGLTNPIGLAALVIGGLVAAGVALYQNWDGIKASAKEFADMMKVWGTSIRDNASYAFEGMKDRVTTNFNIMVNGLKKAFSAYANFFINRYNSLISGLNKFQVKVPDWVPSIGGMTYGFNIPTIPLFARGGIATRPSIFGEAGPEAAIPLKRTPRSYDLLFKTANILGLKEDNRSAKNSNRGNLTIQIYESNNARETAREVIEIVKNYFGDPDDEGRLVLG
jgi:hypothetical protein